MLTGSFLLFAAEAEPLISSDIFHLKLLLMAAAPANALVFSRLWSRQLPVWLGRALLTARLLAADSLLPWCAAATAGSLIGYG